MQINSKSNKYTIKLASLSLLLLIAVAAFPDYTAEKANETSVTVSDEIFNVQGVNKQVENNELEIETKGTKTFVSVIYNEAIKTAKKVVLDEK